MLIKYSNKYGVCNKFEIERTQKICDYFKIPLKKIKLDYSKKNTFPNGGSKQNLNQDMFFQSPLITFIKWPSILRKIKNEDRVFNGDE